MLHFIQVLITCCCSGFISMQVTADYILLLDIHFLECHFLRNESLQVEKTTV